MKLLLSLMFAPAVFAQLLYVGTYTDTNAKGIYAYRFDPKTGKLDSLGLMAETPNPTFLAIHPNGKYLYAVNEVNTYEGKRAGSVSAFAVEASTGKLTPLNQVSSGGAGPCHIIVDHTGKVVAVANYGGGSLASFPVQGDGRLGEAASFIQNEGSSANPQRQKGPHAHSVNIPKNNKFVLATDLGLDKVLVYKVDPSDAKLTPNQPPSASVKPGSGPRHLAFAPDQKHVYVINEMASSVTAFDYDANNGTLKEIQTVSTLPSDFHGESTTAEVQMDARGRYLYGSNRGHNSIAVFAVDPKAGSLKLIQNMSTGGSTPRNFSLDPSGRYLLAANQQGNNIVVFRVNRDSGKLEATGTQVELGSPVCLVFK